MDRKVISRRLFIACSLMLATVMATALPAGAQAQDVKAAEQFIESTGNKVVSALKDGTATGDNAGAWFSNLLNEVLDIETMGRFTLGRYWRSASPAQQEEFLAAFKQSLVKVYTKRLSEYSGEDFKLVGSRPEGDKDVLVTTRIMPPSGQPIDADWRVRTQSDGSFKIIDFVVGNVSLLASQRSEYAAVIQRNNGSIEALIEAIKAKTPS
jgi:phospholipid transport system substrate-binding protein